MLEISQRAKNVSPSLTLAITEQANRMKAQGIDVVGFGVGEPDFDTPSYVVDAAKYAMDRGMTKYTAVAGMKELRENISKKLAADNGLVYAADRIVVSNGGKQALFNVFQTIIEPGDEVILLAPYWLSYPEMVKFCGGKVVAVDLADDGFQLNVEKIEKAVTDKTKAILINTPNNPTGAVYGGDSLRALAAMLEKYPDIWVISDEIYEKLVYDGEKHVSFASVDGMYNRTFVVNGMSKGYAMTGWRIGYTACPSAETAKALCGLQSHQTSGANTIAQYASSVALTGGGEFMAEMKGIFDGRRKLMYEGFEGAKHVTVNMPKGAFYMMVDVSGTFGKSYRGETINSAPDFAALLLKHAHVAVVPCDGFGAPKYIRLSYATGENEIKKGTSRIKEFLEEVK